MVIADHSKGVKKMAKAFTNGTDIIIVSDNREEYFSIKEFNEAYNMDLLDELRWKKERRKIRQDWFDWAEKVIEYYDAFEVLVRACGDFVNTTKFRKNLYRHWGERTWSPILEVRKDYPSHGDVKQLDSKSAGISGLLMKLNESATNIGLPKLTKKELSKLKNDIITCDTKERQKKYYRRIKRYRESLEIHSLQEWIEDVEIIGI